MSALGSDPSLDPLAGLVAAPDGSYDVEGTTITMPVHVRSANMASATFLVPADLAQSVIDSTGLSIARKARGKCVVSLALVKYIDCDLGDYDELGLCFVVEDPPGAAPTPKGGVATYIHRLPVSQEFTCHAGRGIWGFPKWVDDLRVDVSGPGATANLASQVSVRLKRGVVPVPSRPMTMVCYSNDSAGGLLRTEWITHNTSTRLGFGRRVADVQITGGGPFAADLRALGFPRKPLMTMFAGSMRATFESPVRL